MNIFKATIIASTVLMAGGFGAQARDLTGAVQLDASSSLELSPGVKDPVRIRAFVAAALR